MSIRSRALFTLATLTLLVAPIVPTHAQAPECSPRPRSLVSWWRGEGDATDELGRNPGAEQGPVAYETGIIGQAFAFDRTGLVEATTTGLPVGNANRTLELWAKMDDVAGHNSIFAGYGVPGRVTAAYALGRLLDSDVSLFSVWGEGIEGPVLEAGRWYHVAVTNVGDRAHLYIDGTEVKEGKVQIRTPPNSSFTIGGVVDFVTLPVYMVGLVDEVSVYDQALSADEIRAIYEAGEAGKCLDTTAPPLILEPKYKGGKLTLEGIGANIINGDLLEVSGGGLSEPEQFVLTPNKSGTKWMVKKSARSVPGGLRLSEALPANTTVTLTVRNPDGTASAPVDFTR